MEMTHEEICRSYRLAKDKNEHVARLADLNLCDKKTILDILSENGEITGIKRPEDKPKKKAVRKFSPEIKQEIWKLAEEGVQPKDIAERLGYTPEQISNQLYFMRKSFAKENAVPKSTSEPEQPANLEEQLLKLKAENVVFDLSEMFIHLKNLFAMAREVQFLGADSAFINSDTLMVAGESLCDTYINKLDDIVGQII